MSTKNRAELKKYFVKNAIPTEENFAELIDGTLNFSDDGFFKSVDNPLKIQGTKGKMVPEPDFSHLDPGRQRRAKDSVITARLARQHKPLLEFSTDFSKPPEWKLDMNAEIVHWGNPMFLPGLNFVARNRDNKDQSVLFLDQNNGNIGIGTTQPYAKLHVSGGPSIFEQESWTWLTSNDINSNLSFKPNNPIDDSSSSFHIPGYFKDSLGIVHLTGAVFGKRRIDKLNPAFLLPDGYRPERRVSILAGALDDHGHPDRWTAYVLIDATGEVFIEPRTNNVDGISFDGITFRAGPYNPLPSIVINPTLPIDDRPIFPGVGQLPIIDRNP